MKNVLLLLMLSAGLCTASCDSWQEGWTEEYRTEFKRSCLEGEGRAAANPEAYCDCALQKTEKRYPTIAAFMEQTDTEVYKKDLEGCKK